MIIVSPKTHVKLHVTKLFELTNNCQNFAHYISDEVKDITATEDSCSFTIENITKVRLKILEKIPHSYIRFVAENDKNIPLFITLQYTPISETETDVEASLDIEIPIFLKPLIQKPLENFIKTLSEKIKTKTENIEL